MSKVPDWVRQGFEAEMRQDYAEAERCYTKAFELKPRHTDYHLDINWPKGDDVPLGQFENFAEYLEYLGKLKDIERDPKKVVRAAKIRKKLDLERYVFISDLYISTEVEPKYSNLASLELCRANGRKIAKFWEQRIDVEAFEDLMKYVYGPQGHNCRLRIQAQERDTLFDFEYGMTPGGGEWGDSSACTRCNRFIPVTNRKAWPGDPPYDRPKRCPFCGESLELKTRRPFFQWVQYDPTRPILSANKLDFSIEGEALLIPVMYDCQPYWCFLYEFNFLFLVSRDPLKYIQLEPGNNIKVEGARPYLLGPFTIYFEIDTDGDTIAQNDTHLTRIFPESKTIQR